MNIDHIATIRQARRGTVPDPVAAARLCARAGATSIVCHLREDRRHIQDRDVSQLTRRVPLPLNVEMSIAREIVTVALAHTPSQVTLVPERRQELTTEGGLDVVRLSRRLAPLLRTFHARGIHVSVFIDPIRDQLTAARDCGATIVELHTGRYANARTARARRGELHALARAATQGKALGLRVAAGHGLDYENVGPVARLPEIEELNIGFAIIVRALFVGLERAVGEMVARLPRHRPHAL